MKESGPLGVSLLGVAELVRGVSYKSTESRSSPAPGLVPIIRANNIQDGELVFQDLVYVPVYRVAANQRIRKDDIVIACRVVVVE
jgi:type I restriction enzyme S subunit